MTLNKKDASMRIHTLDLNFRGHAQTIASYLVMGPEGPFLIECGPTSTLPTLEKELARFDLRVQDVRDVLVTHIHLDHAGCVGWWAAQGARVYVHEVGAPHVIDPTKLIASARRIYGDRLEPLFGELTPGPAENVISVPPGEKLSVGGVTVEAMDTPGHAKHHHVFVIDDLAFTGDAAGVRLPGTAYCDVPAVPPEFHLELWMETLDRLRARSFSRLYPTHFGPVDDVREHLERFTDHVRSAADFIRTELEKGTDRDGTLAGYVEWNRVRSRELGVSDEVFAAYEAVNPMSMSVDGILRYWTKKLG